MNFLGQVAILFFSCIINNASPQLGRDDGNIAYVHIPAAQSPPSSVGLPVIIQPGIMPRAATEDLHQLLVIVLGGMRWDFLNHTLSTLGGGFRTLRETGVQADFLMPVFPSLTSPNLYSLMTGRYPADHGIIGDRMFDKVSRQWFMGPTTPDPSASWWDTAEPLWITATRSGKRTELYWWPGCEPSLQGTRPELCEPYRSWSQLPDGIGAWRGSLAQVIDKFQQSSVSLAVYYIDHVLKTAKTFGANPEELKLQTSIHEVDQVLKEVQDTLRSKGLDNKVTLLVMSDHGITDVNHLNRISLNELIDARDIERIIDNGALFNIIPAEGKDEKVYQSLIQGARAGVKVYRESELPTAWRYRHSKRTSPITALAEPGFVLQWGGDASKFVSGGGPWGDRVVSGYDPSLNTDMRGVFFVRGPDFKTDYRHNGVRITDVYNIMSSVLRLQTLPNQGVWNNVRQMFHSPWEFSAASPRNQASFLFTWNLLITVAVVQYLL